jgi:hypothetical protein
MCEKMNKQNEETKEKPSVCGVLKVQNKKSFTPVFSYRKYTE